MVSLPIIIAASAEHAAEGGLPGQFGLEGPYLLSQIISFSVVAYILYRFAFKPVLATIEERKAKIEEGLKYAEEMKGKLADAESQHKELVQKASLEAQQIVNDARSLAEGKVNQAAQDAVARAEDIIKKAETQIELDRKAMVADAQSEIARLVVATTSKVLTKELSDDEKNRYAESASAALVDSNN